MANEFSKWIQSCKASESVRDACLSLYESVTEPTLYLRRAYKTVKDCEYTPKFNKEWHKRNNDGTWGPVHTVLDNQFMLKDIASAIDPDDPDTGIPPEELKQLEECDYWDLDENDTYRILEAVPQYAVEHIRNSDEYQNSDYSAMTFNNTVVNQWLVHNTDHAWDIWSDGQRCRAAGLQQRRVHPGKRIWRLPVRLPHRRRPIAVLPRRTEVR